MSVRAARLQLVDSKVVEQRELLQEDRPLTPRTGLADGQAAEVCGHWLLR